MALSWLKYGISDSLLEQSPRIANTCSCDLCRLTYHETRESLLNHCWEPNTDESFFSSVFLCTPCSAIFVNSLVNAFPSIQTSTKQADWYLQG